MLHLFAALSSCAHSSSLSIYFIKNCKTFISAFGYCLGEFFPAKVRSVLCYTWTSKSRQKCHAINQPTDRYHAMLISRIDVFYARKLSSARLQTIYCELYFTFGIGSGVSNFQNFKRSKMLANRKNLCN